MKRSSLMACAAWVTGLALGPVAVAQSSLDASIARGARLYENWQTESTAREQVLPNPAFKTKDVRVEALLYSHSKAPFFHA